MFSRGGKYGPAGRAHGQQDWARPFLMAALAQSHTCVSNLPRNSRKAVYGIGRAVAVEPWKSAARVDLCCDIETMIRVSCGHEKGEAPMAAHPALPVSDHKEAVRLTRRSRHIPFGTLLLSTLLLSGIFSMISTVWSYGPVHLIP